LRLNPRDRPIYPQAPTTLKNALARLLSAHAANVSVSLATEVTGVFDWTAAARA
jgi:hypothetical protein